MPATIRRPTALRLPSKGDEVTLRLGRQSVTLTHLEKIFWPEAARFRHGTRFVRWRPDKAPTQCRMEQLK